jgi:hypothetical protein
MPLLGRLGCQSGGMGGCTGLSKVGLSAHLKWPSSSLLMSASPTSQATRLRTQTRQYPDGGPQHAPWQKTAQANSPDFGSAFGALLVHGGRFSPPTNNRVIWQIPA